MKRFSLWAAGVTAAALLSAGAAASLAGQETRTFTKSDNNGKASLSVGQSFVIKLPARMGTGYSWKVAAIPAGVKAAGDAMEGAAAAPGGTEAQVFKFVAEKSGGGAISILYRRPWEKDTPPADAFTLNVSVKP